MPLFLKYLIAVLLFLLIWAAAVYFSKPKIEADLTARSQATLAELGAGYDSLDVSFTGRDGSLSGELSSDLLATDFSGAVASVWGVRLINSNGISIKPKIETPVTPAVTPRIPKDKSEPAPAPAVSEPKPEAITPDELESYTIYFEFDQYSLSESARETLKNLATRLESLSGALEIQGHTDQLGPESYNDQLGSLRAKSVEQFLLDINVSAEKISVVSYGETRPAIQNPTLAERKQNRRVVFLKVE